ncbi:AAA family ATPase [Nitriliruptor alkaliphilus]|uniref:AAA family ATPase n=1 Tax=Nitriliruptor alkaliphilus TaxID=427918 RepID=UPI00069827B8|nr:AAA family ATPase [Nitriliruptor alkaliphilus]
MRGGGWLRAIGLDLDKVVDRDVYPYTLRAVQALEDEVTLDPAVTFLVGENGSGKSTLIEALAVAAGFNAEGGSRNFNFETRSSTSPLHESLRVIRDVRRPSTGFFLRAESFFNVATQVEELGPEVAQAYGDRGLHEQSHGESFLSLALHRFGPNGLYLLDEPEAALSPQGCLALLRRIHDLVDEGGQFIIATHSPLLMAYPYATIYELDDRGLEAASYDGTRHVSLYRAFLASPEAFLRHLLE